MALETDATIASIAPHRTPLLGPLTSALLQPLVVQFGTVPRFYLNNLRRPPNSPAPWWHAPLAFALFTAALGTWGLTTFSTIDHIGNPDNYTGEDHAEAVALIMLSAFQACPLAPPRRPAAPDDHATRVPTGHLPHHGDHGVDLDVLRAQHVRVQRVLAALLDGKRHAVLNRGCRDEVWFGIDRLLARYARRVGIVCVCMFASGTPNAGGAERKPRLRREKVVARAVGRVTLNAYVRVRLCAGACGLVRFE